jgi:hypothetical protein
LLKFLSTRFPHSTGLKPFSADHRRMIGGMERAIRGRGRRVNAVYRGFAKTTITENTAIWAALYGLSDFVLVTAINQNASANIIDSIKAELAENDLLAEDFPEVCGPIAALDNKPQRARHQTSNGEHTHIVWRADTIVLPTIPGSVASGAIITAKPFAKARGVTYKRRDGTQVRPSLVINDDPQDETSAGNPRAVRKNLSILTKGILQTGGHRAGLTVIVNGTIIAVADMIDTLLADPAWDGERVPMVAKWADAHEEFWLGEYAAARRTFDRSVDGDQARAHAAATSLYRANRKRADAGCKVSWAHCHAPDELSAIQHAYNILIDDGPEVFASEYQQAPLVAGAGGPLHLEAALIVGKLSGLARGRVPKRASHQAAYIDVHRRLLYYCVSAWTADFGGGPIDYGTHPQQPCAYFAESSAPIAMADAHPGTSEDAWILAGLAALCGRLLAKPYSREDGATARIGRILIDCKWGAKTELVKQFCRRHPQGGSIILPAAGVGLGPTKKAFSEYRPEPGTTVGLGWRLATQPSGDRVVSIDTNFWKTHAAGGLLTPMGTPGAWELFGRDPAEHALFADHCTAELPKTIVHKETGRERIVWEIKPGGPDNHYWDCLVGSAVAGSMLGAAPSGMETATPLKPWERPSLADLAGRGKR